MCINFALVFNSFPTISVCVLSAILYHRGRCTLLLFSLHLFICSRLFYVFFAALSLKYTLCMLFFLFLFYFGYLYKCGSLQLLHQIHSQFGARERDGVKGRERYKAIETTKNSAAAAQKSSKLQKWLCSRSSALAVCMYHLFNVPMFMSIFALFSAERKNKNSNTFLFCYVCISMTNNSRSSHSQCRATANKAIYK